MNLNYKFKKQDLLKLAMTHPSMTKDGKTESFERLEFLGDSVLNMIIAEEVFKRYPDFKEGQLSQVISALVRSESLANVARKIGLGNELILDIGEEKCGGRNRDSNLENALEALVAAVYLDSNSYEKTREVFLALFEDLLKTPEIYQERDFKSQLQEILQKNGFPIPLYKIVEERGLAHEKSFTVKVSVPEWQEHFGEGNSRKKAEQKAAEAMLSQVKIKFNNDQK